MQRMMTPIRLSIPLIFRNSGGLTGGVPKQWGADWLSSFKPDIFNLIFYTFPHTPHSMDPVAWFLKISPTPRSASSNGSPSAVSRLSSLVRRSSTRPCKPDGKSRQNPPLSVSWDTHIEVSRPLTRSVSWSAEVEVIIIPARECVSMRTG